MRRDKRQRMSPSSNNNNNDGINIICNLPDSLVSYIGSYISIPSRALFASALTPSTFSWRGHDWNDIDPSTEEDPIRIKIVSNYNLLGGGSFETLDFSEVEKELVAKLNDEHLCTMLVCFDAKSTIKVLKLVSCLNIIGWGLEPLRGSRIIRQLDLSLVGRFESPTIEADKVVVLSEDAVLPIIQSIVDVQGSKLKQIVFPNHWSSGDEQSQRLGQFIESYSRHLNGQNFCCAREACGVIINRESPRDDWFYNNMQASTCYECGAMACLRCEEDSELRMTHCEKCEKVYCENCVPESYCENWCGNMGGEICSGCLPTFDCQCGNTFCTDCVTKCDECGEGVCEGCNDSGDRLCTCTNCKRSLCYSCSKMTHCGNSRYECYGVMCNDCHPKDWECMWCDPNDDDAAYYHRRYGQKCASCYKDSTTCCSSCGKKKLREEDYESPPIPTSYWTSRGFDETYVEVVEKFLEEMKRATLQLKSGDRLQYDESISLRYGKAEIEGVTLQHDDIFLPHWKEFVDALQQYSHEPEKRHDRVLHMHNVQLPPSVSDMLTPILQLKGFTLDVEGYWN